jgi:hypothetical protein
MLIKHVEIQYYLKYFLSSICIVTGRVLVFNKYFY